MRVTQTNFRRAWRTFRKVKADNIGLAVTIALLAVGLGTYFFLRSPKLTEIGKVPPKSRHPTLAADTAISGEFQHPATGMAQRHQLAAQLDHDLLAVGMRDIGTGLAFIEANYPPERRSLARVYLIEEICSGDLSKIPLLIPQLAENDGRSRALGIIASAWVRKDIQAFLSFASSLQGTLKNDLLGHAVSALVSENRTTEAVEVWDSMPFSRARSEALLNVVRGLATEDPIDAIDWSTTLNSPEETRNAQSSLGFLFTRTKNTEALERLTQTTSHPDVKAQLERQRGRVLGSTDHEAGTNPFNQPTSEMVKASVISSVPAHLLKQAESVIVELRDPAARSVAVNNYVKRLAEDSPRAAANWALTAPNETRLSAVQTVTRQWYDVDSNQVSEWINGLPSGRERDAALEALVTRLVKDDPHSARDLASSISDAQTRSRILAQLQKRR